MAISGYIPGTTNNNNVEAQLHWTSTGDPATNTSKLNYKLELKNKTGKTIQLGGKWVRKLTGFEDRDISATVELKQTDTDWTVVWSRTDEGIQHGADGTKSVTIRMTGGLTSEATQIDIPGTTIQLETIQRACTFLSVTDRVNFGGNLKMVLNRPSTALTPKIWLSLGNRSTTITVAGSNTTVSWPLPAEWADQLGADQTELWATARLTTWNGETQVGAADTRYWTAALGSGSGISAASGWVSAATGNEAQSTLEGWGIAVQWRSWAVVTFDESYVTPSLGSSVSGFTATVDGTTYAAVSQGSGIWRAVCGAYRSSGNVPITVTVTDARGQSYTETVTRYVYSYTAPRLYGVDVYRCDSNGNQKDTGSYIRARASGECDSLGNRNTCGLRVRYKSESDSSWGAWTTLSQGEYSLLGGALDPDLSYDVEVWVTDTLGGAASQTARLSGQKVTFNALASNDGAAFGKKATARNMLDVNWNLHAHGNISTDGRYIGLDIRTGYINLSVGQSAGHEVLAWMQGAPTVIVGGSYYGARVKVTNESGTGFDYVCDNVNQAESLPYIAVYWGL